MRHYLILPAMLLGIALFLVSPSARTQVRSQDIIYPLELSIPLFKVSNSLYNKIDFIDSRTNAANIGIVDEGLMPNQVEKIVLKTPVLPQLTQLLQSLTDNTARDGEIVFQLKRFRFIEQSGVRYCFLSAALYAKKADRYSPVSRLNTVIPLHNRIYKSLQSTANQVLADFIAKGLVAPASDSVSYTLHEVEKIDSVEKSRIPLYTATNYTDGLYRSPRSFFEQRPDWTAFGAKLRGDGSIGVVTAGNGGQNDQVVEVDKLYALVYHGVPYMATELGCYPMKRVGDDFYFTGMLRKDAGQGNVPGLSVSGQPGPSLMSGITGVTLTRYGLKTLYQMMLDHETGGFLFVRVLSWNYSASPKPY